MLSLLNQDIKTNFKDERDLVFERLHEVEYDYIDFYPLEFYSRLHKILLFELIEKVREQLPIIFDKRCF